MVSNHVVLWADASTSGLTRSSRFVGERLEAGVRVPVLQDISLVEGVIDQGEADF